MNNCIFLMIDSLRFDAINAIEPREDGFLKKFNARSKLNTPSFDYLVEHGATVPRLHAPFAATPPSTSSVLTGLYPREHGVCGFNRPLRQSVKTLPEYFSEAGYHTVLMNGINVFEINGMGDRFDEHVFGSISDLIKIVRDKNKEDTPVLAFFHTMDIHRPYFLSRYPDSPGAHRFALEFLKEWSDKIDLDPPQSLEETVEESPETLGRYSGMNTPAWNAMSKIHYHFKEDGIELENPVNTLMNLYLKGISWFDKNHLSKYVDFLEETEAGQNSITMLTGDHGEALRFLGEEYTFYHGGKPVEDLIRVPGIVSGADLSDDTFDQWELTSLVDLMPTLLSLFDIDYDDDSLSGLDLLETPPEDRFIYSEFSQQMKDQDFPRDAVLNWHSVITSDGFKFYRQGLPVKEEDFELPLEKFIELMTRKICLSMPDDTVYEHWQSQLDDNDEEAIKETFTQELLNQYSTKDPELYHWINDHFESENLLDQNDDELSQTAHELDEHLCDRFPDPGEIAWQEEGVEVTEEEEEEVTEGLKGLGYL